MLVRSKALNNVPEEKFHAMLQKTIEDCDVCGKDPSITLNSGLCQNCSIKNRALHLYHESNIPVRYWGLEMERDFDGSATLLQHYRDVAGDLKKTYDQGLNLCFAGKHGLGKTMTMTNILKRAVEAGYSCLYCNLSDIVNLVVSRSSDDNQIARKELLNVSFLLIDEFDPRYLQSDKAADLFGKTLEEIVRSRTQNCIPILMCSNSINPAEGFIGPIAESVNSLMGMIQVKAIIGGKDFRRKKQL